MLAVTLLELNVRSERDSDMADKKGVWVLTIEHNEPYQHGAYFCAVWDKKPDTEQLAEFFGYKSGTPASVMKALQFVLHLEKGGGRQATENQWYNLEFVEFGKDMMKGRG
jgi:hypothetical protein